MNDLAKTRREQPNRELLDPLTTSPTGTRGALVPTNAGEAMEFAKVMASGDIGVPAHLRNKPGVCLRIVSDAMNTGMSPFHLAYDSYAISGRLAYGAKSIHAMVLASGLLDGDLSLDFHGEGEAMVCTVTGRRRGSGEHAESYALRNITVRNSPLWKSQPRQQMGYYAVRAWCRLHVPDAIMGLVAREDDPLPMRDVTPRAEPATAVGAVAQQLGINGDVAQGTERGVPNSEVAGSSPAVTTMGEVKSEDDATTQSGQDEGDAAPAQPESSASPTSHKPSPAEAFVTRAMGAYASAPTGIAISDFKTENRGHYEALSDDQQATLKQAESARRKELKAGAG